MASVNIPHFDLPFRFVANKHAKTVEQDSVDDVTNCVHACLLTRRGTRYYVPNFGITDPAFENEPIDTQQIELEVSQNEPRAQMVLDSTINVIEELIIVQVGVDIG